MAEKNIVVNFEVDTSGLEKTVTLLEQTGQISKEAADAVRANFAKTNQTEQESIKNVETLKNELQKLYQVSSKDVELGIADALTEAGVTAKDFENALKNANKEQTNTQNQAKTSKARLKEMKEELIQLSLQGKQNTKQFAELSAAAGHLEDTIGDVGKTVKHLGSDTHVLDGLINAAQGLAGGFAVAQGAAALFGDENKELQETLLKVNAAMAILQGLQQIQNVLQKDSAASLLLMKEAQVANTAATEGATLATKAWNLVLSLNPIVLVVALVASLAKVVYDYATNARQAEIDTDQLNKAIERTANATDRVIKQNENQSALKISQLKRQKASQQEIANEELALLKRNHDATIDRQNELNRQLKENSFANPEAKKKVNDELARLSLQSTDELYKIAIKGNDNIAAANAAAAEAAKKKAEDDKKAAEDALKARIQSLTDLINRLKTQQLDFSPETDSFRQLQVKINNTELAIKKLTDRTAAYNLAAKETAQANEKLFSSAVQRVEETRKSADELFDEAAARSAESIKKNAHLVADEFKKSDPINNENDRKERLKKIASDTQIIAGYLGQAAQTLGNFFEQQAQAQLDSIERQKDRVQELAESGEITEKEAKTRLRRLDQAEKAVQLQQAKRQKAIAIFEAVSNTAVAVTKALAEAGPALAIIVGVLGAAQIALIASKPLPKFASGKVSGGYQGPGIIGEAGPELHVTKDGALLATKPTVTYLAKSDTVFNARDTRRLMADARLSRQYQLYGNERRPAVNIDYKRFGKEVGDNVHNTAVHLTEKGLFTLNERNGNFQRYLSARRGF